MSRPSKAIPGLAVGDEVWVLDWPVEGRAARARVSWVHKGRPAFRAKVGRGTREYTDHEEGVQWWRTEAAMNAARRDSRRMALESGVQFAREVLAHYAKLRAEAHDTLHRTLTALDEREARHREALAYAEATLAEFDAALAALDAEVQSHAEAALAKFDAASAALDAEVQS